MKYLGNTSTFDLSNYDGYQSFTNDNFIVGITSLNTGCDTYMAASGNSIWYMPTATYDSSTGLLTISLYTNKNVTNNSCSFYNISTGYVVYLIY